jgi:SAM-dependent methyltransferase
MELLRIRDSDAVPGAAFDRIVCCFGLSDIDDLDGAMATVARSLRPDGRFVFPILHPCFPSAGDISGSWPPDGSSFHEGRWNAVGSRSTPRQQVGGNHRMLSTYIAALSGHGLNPLRHAHALGDCLRGPGLAARAVRRT